MAADITELSFQQRSVLNLLEAHIQSQRDAIKTLESKAQYNFTIINIIAAIVAALNLELGATDSVQQIVNERPLLVLISIGYVAAVYMSIRALVLRKQATAPMTVTLANTQDWSRTSLEHHYEILTKSYVQIFEHNEKIVALKGRRVQRAHTIIAVIIVLIAMEGLGLWPQIAGFVETTLLQLGRLFA